MRCGLLGQKLGHSYSPQIHRSLGGYTYSLFEREPDDLAAFLRNGDFDGINVTIPYKKAVIPYCDRLSETAEKLGAVNTIVRRDDGRLVGHNTDYFGFSYMVQLSGLAIAGKKALVLGSGGASVTAVAVLKELDAQAVVISRTGKDNYENLQKHADAAIIVNATPVGMYPQTGHSPIDLGLFPNLEGVLDLIYNPARTALLMDAEERGLVAMNGLWMLVAQAKESAKWFTGEAISNDQIRQIHDTLQMQMRNIVLIGMPGCGKTTVGKLLADRLGRTFVDADTCIVEKAGMPIPEIFAKFGESGFRKIESEVLAQLGMQSGLIIATGGGCVTVSDNYRSLHQNGRIVWLRRSIDYLPTEGRPLSQTQNLLQMYEVRKPLYARFSDYTADNNGTAAQTAEAVAALLKEVP